VAARLAERSLNLHGWVYDIESGQVRRYDDQGGLVPVQGAAIDASERMQTQA
jgi:carbonic anhydrase